MSTLARSVQFHWNEMTTASHKTILIYGISNCDMHTYYISVLVLFYIYILNVFAAKLCWWCSCSFRFWHTSHQWGIVISVLSIITKMVSTLCLNHFKISSKYYISFGAAIILHIAYLLLRANIWPKLWKSIRYPSFLIFSLFDDGGGNGYRRGGLKWTHPERVWRNSIKIAWNEGASLLLIGHKCEALFRHKVVLYYLVLLLP